jgi:hypothetical protein
MLPLSGMATKRTNAKTLAITGVFTMAKKVAKSPYVLTSKEAKARAKKIAKARAVNAKSGMSERVRRQMNKDLRRFMGEKVTAAKYDIV